jgi:hypothetical protein
MTDESDLGLERLAQLAQTALDDLLLAVSLVDHGVIFRAPRRLRRSGGASPRSRPSLGQPKCDDHHGMVAVSLRPAHSADLAVRGNSPRAAAGVSPSDLIRRPCLAIESPHRAPASARLRPAPVEDRTRRAAVGRFAKRLLGERHGIPRAHDDAVGPPRR